MKVKTVQCKNFEMWNWSPMMLIGKTPKIKFVCGECEKISEGIKKCHMLKSKLQFPPRPTVNLSYIFP